MQPRNDEYEYEWTDDDSWPKDDIARDAGSWLDREENRKREKDPKFRFNEMQRRLLQPLYQRLERIVQEGVQPEEQKRIIICEASCGTGKTLSAIMVYFCAASLRRMEYFNVFRHFRQILWEAAMQEMEDEENKLQEDLKFDRLFLEALPKDWRSQDYAAYKGNNQAKIFRSLAKAILKRLEAVGSQRKYGEILQKLAALAREEHRRELAKIAEEQGAEELKVAARAAARGSKVPSKENANCANPDEEDDAEYLPRACRPVLILYLFPQKTLLQQMLIGMLKMSTDAPTQKICVPQNMKPELEGDEGQLRREGLPSTGITYFAANDDLEKRLEGQNSCIFAMLQGGDSKKNRPKLITKLQKLEDKFNLIIVCDEVHRMINGGDVMIKEKEKGPKEGEQLNPNWKEDVRCFKSFLKLNFALLVGMTATNLGTSEYLRLLYEEERLNIKPGSVHNFHYTKLESIYAGLTVPVIPTKGLSVEWLNASDMKSGLDYCMSEMEALWKSGNVFNYKKTDEAWEKWKSYTGRQNFCRFYISTASAVIYSCVTQRLRERYLHACEGSKAVAMALSPWQNTLTLCDTEYNVFLSACIMSWLKESSSFVEANYRVIEEIEKRIEQDVQKAVRPAKIVLPKKLETIKDVRRRIQNIRLLISVREISKMTNTLEPKEKKNKKEEKGKRSKKSSPEDTIGSLKHKYRGLTKSEEMTGFQPKTEGKLQIALAGHEDMGRLFQQRDAECWFAFGTYAGLFQGVDLKVMDARVSHTNTLSIKGWMDIQADGRLERPDSEKLKKKAYNLCGISATLPAPVLEELFGDLSAEERSKHLPKFSLIQDDAKEEMEQADKAEMEMLDLLASLDWTEETYLLNKTLPPELFAALASLPFYVLQTCKAQDEDDEGQQLKSALEKLKNMSAEKKIETMLACLQERWQEGGSQEQIRKINSFVHSRVITNSLLQLGRRPLALATKARKEAGLDLADIKELQIGSPFYLFSMTEINVQEGNLEDGTYAKRVGCILSQAGVEVKSKESETSRFVVFQPLFASNTPEDMYEALDSLAAGSDEGLQYASFRSPNAQFHIDKKSGNLMHTDSEGKSRTVAFEALQEVKGKSGRGGHTVGQLVQKTAAAWKLLYYKVEAKHLSQGFRWRSRDGKKRLRDLKAPLVNVYFQGSAKNPATPKPIPLVANRTVGAVSLVQKSSLRSSFVFVEVPERGTKRGRNEEQKPQPFQLNKELGRKVFDRLYGARKDNPPSSCELGKISQGELETGPFYLAARAHDFPDGFRIVTVHHNQQSISVAKSGTKHKWQMDLIDGGPVFAFKHASTDTFWGEPLPPEPNKGKQFKFTIVTAKEEAARFRFFKIEGEGSCNLLWLDGVMSGFLVANKITFQQGGKTFDSKNDPKSKEDFEALLRFQCLPDKDGAGKWPSWFDDDNDLSDDADEADKHPPAKPKPIPKSEKGTSKSAGKAKASPKKQPKKKPAGGPSGKRKRAS